MKHPIFSSPFFLIFSIGFFLPFSLVAQTPKIPDPPVIPPAANVDMVEIQMPNNPVTEVINFYEMLTGRRIIRDANLAGPNLSILVSGKVPKKDAIALIESALLLNGYSIVPMSDNTSKILGQGRSPLGESIPLFADPSLLPHTEELASYFMLLNYISPQDALTVFQAYVTLRPQGTIVAVPNSNALVITDNTTLIRRLVALQRFIDVPGARVLTEFISLARADAEKVAELINKLLEEEKQANKATAVAAIDGAAPNVENRPASTVGGGDLSSIQKLTPLIKVVPDPRTNRILVVAPENRMAYLQRLIRDFDAAVSLEHILQRPLKFVAAGEVISVLQSILAEGDKDASSASGASSHSSSSTSSSSTSSNSGSLGGTGSSKSSGGGGAADMLSDPRADTSPLAVSVGKARIIADRSSNKIIVIGPPEIRAKAERVLDLLDRRPKQIYLATIIGQLTLRDEMEFGIDYLLKFNQLNQNLGGAGMLRNRAGTDIVPSPSSLIANSVFPAISGLTLYGTIGDSVDVFIKALKTDNNFKIISRPVVYTANNKKAVISSGSEVPVPTSTSTQATGLNSSALTSNIGFKDVVLKLEVVPLVNSEDEVTLSVAQQNDQILEYVPISGNDVPVIGTQKLTTTVTVKNRNTIVLGGLITEEDTRNQSGMPILSSIPGVSYFFSSTVKKKVRRELIILIQPFIISDHEDLNQAQQRIRESSRLDDQIQELKKPEIRRAEAIFPVNPVR